MPMDGSTGGTVDTSPKVSDEVKCTTCYMCACRCGIRVHLRDGRIRYIEGNKDHPVNRGVLCAKGSAGIMNHYSPARLSKPLLRIGERGAGDFKEIEWDEALELAPSGWATSAPTIPKEARFLHRPRPEPVADRLVGQPVRHAELRRAHGGFCSVNMAAAGLYTIGGSFWEFGEPDWEHARYFMLFGVAEDHDSNPIKAGLAKLKARGAKYVSVNPVKTGYSGHRRRMAGRIAPGTDGLFVMALIHELLKADKIDLEYLVRYTNAPWLVMKRRRPVRPRRRRQSRCAGTRRPTQPQARFRPTSRPSWSAK